MGSVGYSSPLLVEWIFEKSYNNSKLGSYEQIYKHIRILKIFFVFVYILLFILFYREKFFNKEILNKYKVRTIIPPSNDRCDRNPTMEDAQITS